MDIIRGRIDGAQKVVICGPEGIGKSTFASKFPDALFDDVEGSTKHMDVARLPKPSSWTMLLEHIRYLKANPICGTYVIDTADWAEMLCIEHICSKAQVAGLEGFGYGKGYMYLFEEFGRFLNLLEDLIDIGINIVVTAHMKMRKFEQPDEMGAYDRWELKLQKTTAPLLKEWADMVLFANYKTLVINVDGQGAQKGRNKAQGGKRVIYTSHHPCWDAKNRHGLAEELPFEYSAIAHCIPERKIGTPAPKNEKPKQASAPAPSSKASPLELQLPEVIEQKNIAEDAPAKQPDKKEDGPIVIPRALAELMVKDKIQPEDIQWVVAVKGNGGKGYYPIDTPIENYDPEFVNGALVGMWPQIVQMVKQKRSNEEWDKLKKGEPNSIEEKVS